MLGVVIPPHKKVVSGVYWSPAIWPSKHIGFRGYITVKRTKENNRFIP
jgi:hypothetical protein